MTAILYNKPSYMQTARTGAPPGYEILKNDGITTSVTAKARSLLVKDMGYEEYFESDGKKYFARTEPHYHTPPTKAQIAEAKRLNIPIRKLVQGPYGWHMGTTIYIKKDQENETLPPMGPEPPPKDPDPIDPDKTPIPTGDSKKKPEANDIASILKKYLAMIFG